VNVCQQGFRSVAKFITGGQESTSKPPQAICKTLCNIKNQNEKTSPLLIVIMHLPDRMQRREY
jgi:hypothetical protein